MTHRHCKTISLVALKVRSWMRNAPMVPPVLLNWRTCMHNIVRTATYRSHKLATLTCRHFVSRWFEQRNSATLQIHLHQHPIAPVSLPLDGTVNHMVNRIGLLCVGCADMFPPNLGSVWGVLTCSRQNLGSAWGVLTCSRRDVCRSPMERCCACLLCQRR